MKLWLTGEITQRTADAFCAEVAPCRHRAIRVYVDSAGGLAGPAFQMVDALKQSGPRVTVVVVRGHSAALLLVLGADHVIAARDASGLLHRPFFDERIISALPTAAPMAVVALFGALAKVRHDIARRLAEKGGVEPAVFSGLMDQETHLTAEAMRALGLADEVSVHAKDFIRDWRGLPALEDRSPQQPGLARRRR